MSAYTETWLEADRPLPTPFAPMSGPEGTKDVQHSKFQLKELCIAPRIAPPLAVHNVWESALVDHEVILIDQQQRKSGGEKRYRQNLAMQVAAHFGPQRRYIRSAIAQDKTLEWTRPEWNKIASQIKGRTVDAANADGVGAVLTWLLAVEGYAACAVPATRSAALASMQRATKSLLSTRKAKDWAPLVETVCRLAPIHGTVCADSLDSLNALLATREPVAPVIRVYAGMLSVLFPWLAFKLIVKAPKFVPPLHRQALQ